MTGLKHLTELATIKLKEKHPAFPEHCLPLPKYADKTSNGLTKCVLDWINYNGGLAERISNTGRYIEGEVLIDVLGRSRTTPGKYIPGNGRKGTSDIKALYRGQSLSIEIKCAATKDRQSNDQKEYQKDIERAGGKYIICKTFEDFYQYWITELNK